MVELLRHHVPYIAKAIENGYSPESELARLEARNPLYRTPSFEEREAFLMALRVAFEAVREGDFTSIDDRDHSVVDLLCLACPPNSTIEEICQRKKNLINGRE